MNKRQSRNQDIKQTVTVPTKINNPLQISDLNLNPDDQVQVLYTNPYETFMTEKNNLELKQA